MNVILSSLLAQSGGRVEQRCAGRSWGVTDQPDDPVDSGAIVAIQQVLFRYCRSMDRMDADLALGCFEPQALLEYGGLFSGTAAEFVEWLWPVHAQFDGHTHQLHNALVEVDGKSAASEAYVTVTLRSTVDGVRTDLIGKGRYIDEWRCGAGGWRISRRRFVSDLSSVVAVDHGLARPAFLWPAAAEPPSLISTRDRNDPSYRVLGRPDLGLDGPFMTGVGLCLPQLGEHVTKEVIVGFCRRAEELGYTSLWVQDHYLWPLQPTRGYAGVPGLPIPQQYRSVFAPTELLAAAAVLTDTPRLGTSVLVQGNHWPAPLAQQLATLDVLCDGRLLVGLGQGWNAEEHVAAGTRVQERASRILEFVGVLRACWGADPVSFDGQHFQLPPAIQRPKPVQTMPPLLSGASSAAGLRRTAELFDGWNPAGISVGDAARTVAEMNAQRSGDQGPLTVYLRTFVQFLGPADPFDTIIERLVGEVQDATAQGFEELILEHNFWDEITSPDDWLDVPDRFLPVLDASR